MTMSLDNAVWLALVFPFIVGIAAWFVACRKLSVCWSLAVAAAVVVGAFALEIASVWGETIGH